MSRAARTAPRSRSRQVALQALYAAEHRQDDDVTAAATGAFDAVAASFELPEGARAFAKELVVGVCTHREDLDARIEAATSHWRLDRMALVDRNTLRLGTYEILFGEAPAEVAIDEAVELARRFGGERSPGFVNGVLDAVARQARAEAER